MEGPVGICKTTVSCAAMPQKSGLKDTAAFVGNAPCMGSGMGRKHAQTRHPHTSNGMMRIMWRRVRTQPFVSPPWAAENWRPNVDERDARLQELDKSISALDEQVRQLSASRLRLAVEKAKIVCPFFVGQVLVDRKGRRARYVGIHTDGRSYPLYALARLRTDGSTGQIIPLYTWDEWRPE